MVLPDIKLPQYNQQRTFNRTAQPLAIPVPTQIIAPYAALDCIGGRITIPYILPDPWFGATFRGLSLVDTDNQRAAIDIHVFRFPPSVVADAVPWEPLRNDFLLKPAGRNTIVINGGDYQQFETSDENLIAMADKPDVGIDFDMRGSSTPQSFYVYLQTKVAVTYTTVDGLYLLPNYWIE